MSFVIDETSFFSGLGLDNLFKVKAEAYQARDEVETTISTILPYKHTINVEESDIKVELFHSSITDEQLAKIKTVINDTFEVCQKYKLIPSDTNVNFRMFLFEDRQQYSDIEKSLYNYSGDDTLGFVHRNQGTDALADLLMYKEPSGKINDHTVSHEFVHCVQAIAEQNNNNAKISRHVSEGMAQFFACEALPKEDEHDICGTMDTSGHIIRPIMSLDNIYHGHAGAPHMTGLAMFKFLSNRHPEIITQLSEYFLDGDETKYQDLSDRIECIDHSKEFKNWVNYSYSKMIFAERGEDPKVTTTSKFLSERHPEIITQLHTLFLRGDEAQRSDNLVGQDDEAQHSDNLVDQDDEAKRSDNLVDQINSIRSSREFTNWMNNQQQHSIDRIENPEVSKFLSERHPEIITQLHTLLLTSGNARHSNNLVNQVESIHCSGEFTNWMNDQQQHSIDII